MLRQAIAEAAAAERDGVPARLGEGAIGWICERAGDWPRGDAPALERAVRDLRDPAAIPLLLTLIARRDELPWWSARCLPSWCAGAAAAIPDDRTLTALLGVMAGADDSSLVATVVDGLGARGDRRAADGLRRVLTEPRPNWFEHGRWLAVKAAAALARLGDDSGRAVVVEALADSWLRTTAIEALVLLRPPDLVELLSPALLDPAVRTLAIDALAEVATVPAIRALIALTDDPDRDIAERCARIAAGLVGLPVTEDTDPLPDRAELTAELAAALERRL